MRQRIDQLSAPRRDDLLATTRIVGERVSQAKPAREVECHLRQAVRIRVHARRIEAGDGEPVRRPGELGLQRQDDFPQRRVRRGGRPDLQRRLELGTGVDGDGLVDDGVDAGVEVIGDIRQHDRRVGGHRLEHLLHDGGDQRFPRREMVLCGPARHTGGFGNGSDRRRRPALRGEHVDALVE